jgi:hypothetical protein
MARVAKDLTGRVTSAVKQKQQKKTAVGRTAKKRGRPKTKGAASARTAEVGRRKRRDVRDRLKAMQAELKAEKQQRRAEVKRERANTEAAKADLKAALKRERALMKLIDTRDEAMRGFGDRWTKKRLAEIQKAPKRRRRRTSTRAQPSAQE